MFWRITPLTPSTGIALGSECVYYYKKCDVSAKKCSYAIGYSDDGKTLVPDYLFISYKDQDALSAAENALYLASQKGGSSYIPLTLLETSTRAEPLPVGAKNR